MLRKTKEDFNTRDNVQHRVKFIANDCKAMANSCCCCQ
jgi:hypothetical protein